MYFNSYFVKAFIIIALSNKKKNIGKKVLSNLDECEKGLEEDGILF